ncbi:MAG: hypothetical protein IJV14_14045 [Lachnospiraceae bacterium]|nr:hypothetical protein [Lachnospiraceae bacterium]
MAKFVMNVGFDHQMPDFTVIAPEYEEGMSRDKKLPMIWLLHDFGGDSNDWCRFGNLEGLARNLKAFIICPTARVNYYVDSWEFSRYRSLIMEEMWNFVMRTFPVSEDPALHWIVGCGMGGYGALYYDLMYPGRFGHVGIFDGDLEAPERFFSGSREKFVFPDTFPAEGEFSLKVLASRPEVKPHGLAIAVRKDAPVYEACVRAAEYLREAGYRVNLIEAEPGIEDWSFWTSEFGHVIRHIHELVD